MPSTPNLLLPISQKRTHPSFTADRKSWRMSSVTSHWFIRSSLILNLIGSEQLDSTNCLGSEVGGSTTTMEELSEVCRGGVAVAEAGASCVSVFGSVSGFSSMFSSVAAMFSVRDREGRRAGFG